MWGGAAGHALHHSPPAHTLLRAAASICIAACAGECVRGADAQGNGGGACLLPVLSAVFDTCGHMRVRHMRVPVLCTYMCELQRGVLLVMLVVPSDRLALPQALCVLSNDPAHAACTGPAQPA